MTRKTRKYAGQGGCGGMGSHKHGTSGTNNISPKERHRRRMEAERNEHKIDDRTDWKETLAEVFKK